MLRTRTTSSFAKGWSKPKLSRSNDPIPLVAAPAARRKARRGDPDLPGDRHGGDEFPERRQRQAIAPPRNGLARERARRGRLELLRRIAARARLSRARDHHPGARLEQW